MKKVMIGILTALILLAGILIWKGGAVLDLFFYDMNATMDLPENLYDDESLTKPATE